MKKSQHSIVLAGGFCISIVLVLTLLNGCAVTTHTNPAKSILITTSETQKEVWKFVENPETGVPEMQLVSKDVLKVQNNNLPIVPKTAPQTGNSTQNSDWEFYTTCFLIIALSLYIININSN